MRILSASVYCFLALPMLWAHQEPAKIHGTWVAVEYDQNGIKPPDAITAKMKVAIKGDKLTIGPRIVAEYKPVLSSDKKVEVVFSIDGNKSEEVTYKLEPDKGRIDLIWKGARGETKTTKGVYLLEDDSLKICFALDGKNRPKKFPEAPTTGLVRMVLKRVDK